MKYYVRYREDFDDHEGFFSKEQLKELLGRLQKLGWDHKTGKEGDCEALVYFVIEGKEVDLAKVVD